MLSPPLPSLSGFLLEKESFPLNCCLLWCSLSMEASIASHHPHPHLRRRLHPWPHRSFPAFSSRTVLLKVNRSCPKITATAAIEYDSANFPPFLPPEVKQLRDPFARALASRIQRLPVQVCDAENIQFPWPFPFFLLYLFGLVVKSLSYLCDWALWLHAWWRKEV